MKRYASGKEISQVKANDFVPVSDHTQNNITLRGDQSDYYFSPSKLVFRQEHHNREFFYEATEVGINDRWNPSHVVEDENTNEIFGRVDEDGNIMVLYASDGHAVTRLDEDVCPVGSDLGCRYEHAGGIVLTRTNAEEMGIEIEE